MQRDGAHWFVLGDITKALGMYSNANVANSSTAKYLKQLPVMTSKGKRLLYTLPVDGLIHFLTRSNKDNAQALLEIALDSVGIELNQEIETPISVFRFHDFAVRMMLINDEPWFVLKDICGILDLDNPKRVADRLPSDCVKSHSLQNYTTGKRTMFVDESGLYQAIFESRKPEARAFTEWVTREIMPSIRKTGAYVKPDIAAEALEKLVTNLQAELEAARPKITLAEAITGAENSILIGALAKILASNGVDVGQKRMFDILRQDGYLGRRKGEDYNLPTQKSIESGLFELVEFVMKVNGADMIHLTPKITGKGQQHLIQKYLVEGIE